MSTNHKDIGNLYLISDSKPAARGWPIFVVANACKVALFCIFGYALYLNVHDALTRIGLLKESLEQKSVSIENIKGDINVRRAFAISAKEQSNIFNIEEQGSSIKIFINIFRKIVKGN